MGGMTDHLGERVYDWKIASSTRGSGIWCASVIEPRHTLTAGWRLWNSQAGSSHLLSCITCTNLQSVYYWARDPEEVQVPVHSHLSINISPTRDCRLPWDAGKRLGQKRKLRLRYSEDLVTVEGQFFCVCLGVAIKPLCFSCQFLCCSLVDYIRKTFKCNRWRSVFFFCVCV